MGWDVLKFTFDGGQGAAKVFNYELAIEQAGRDERAEVVQGDGIALGSGTVYLNRLDKLAAAATRAGANPEGVVSAFTDWVSRQRTQF
jgi:hypothetical protein